MDGVWTKSMTSVLIMGVLLLGSLAPAVAESPQAGPVADLQSTLAEIQMQLSNLQSDVTMLQDTVPDTLGPCDVPPVWGKTFAGAGRFVPVLDGLAYCDKETGLVWEGAPTITGGPNNNGARNWANAINHCANREVGGRKGWQLPMREQLASLLDMSNSNPALATGHPFQNVQWSNYWSASSVASTPTWAWDVSLADGNVAPNGKSVGAFIWCVRGDQSFDGNTHMTLH